MRRGFRLYYTINSASTELIAEFVTFRALVEYAIGLRRHGDRRSMEYYGPGCHNRIGGLADLEELLPFCRPF